MPEAFASDIGVTKLPFINGEETELHTIFTSVKATIERILNTWNMITKGKASLLINVNAKHHSYPTVQCNVLNLDDSESHYQIRDDQLDQFDLYE